MKKLSLVLLLSLMYLHQSFSQSVTIPNAIIKFNFNGNLIDSSGNNLHATASNVQLTTDRFGNANSAYAIKGIPNSYITFPHDSVTNRNNYTYSLWANIDSTFSDDVCLLSIGGATNQNPGDGFDQSLSFLGSINTFFGGSYNVGTNPTQSRIYSQKVARRKWYHIVLTRDQSKITMYINGVKVAHSASSLPNTNNQAASYGNAMTKRAVIGSTARLNQYFFKGSIDDIYLYKQTLSEAQVKELYNQQAVKTIDHKSQNPIVKLLFTKNFIDSSGKSNHATNFGSTFTKDRYNRDSSAMYFDGQNDYITIKPDSLLNLNEYTYSAWVNVGTAVTNSYGASILSFGNTIYSQSLNFNIDFWGVNNFIGVGSNHSAQYSESRISSGLISNNTWYHVTLTRNFDRLRLYIDGEQVLDSLLSYTYDNNANYGVDTNRAAMIGSKKGLYAKYFNGIIDDVIIYNRALSKLEVDSLYKSFKPINNTISLNNSEPILILKANKSTADSSAYNRAIEIQNVKYTKDRYGKDNAAFLFDTNTSGLRYRLDSLNPKYYTMSAWVKADTNINYNRLLIAIGSSTSHSQEKQRLVYRIWNGDRFNAYSASTTSADAEITSNEYINRREWNHVASTRDSNTLRLYINGKLVNTLGLNQTFNSNADYGSGYNKISIAYHPYEFNYYTFYGSMDDIVIYRKSLSTTEIDSLFKSYPPYQKTKGPVKLNSPILSLKFSGNTKDSSGYANNGTAYGATLTTDRFGKQNSAYKFNGYNDYIVVKPNMLVGLNEFTYSAWVSVDPANYAGGTTIFSVGGAASNMPGEHYEQSMSFLSDNFTLRGHQFFTGSYNEYGASIVQSKIFSSTQVELDKWYHVTYTRDSNEMNMYVNGVLQAKDSLANLYKYRASYGTGDIKNAIIGSIARGNTYFFYGKIDDVLAYNRAITAKEVDSIYNASKPVGINNYQLSKIKIYPNPAYDYLQIEKENSNNFNLRIYNNMGQLVINEYNISSIYKLDISPLPSGIYALEIIDNMTNESYKEKFLIEK